MQIQLDPDVQRTAADEQSAGSALLEWVRSSQIESGSDVQGANEILREVVGRKDWLKAEQSKALDPLQAAVKTIRGWFAPAVTLCETIEAELKGKIADYVTAEQARQAALLQQAAAVHSTDHKQTVALLAESQAATTEAPQGTSIRHTWQAEIFAPDLVPHEWCTPDVRRIQAAARATKIEDTPMPIAGVRYTKKAIVAVRRG